MNHDGRLTHPYTQLKQLRRNLMNLVDYFQTDLVPVLV